MEVFSHITILAGVPVEAGNTLACPARVFDAAPASGGRAARPPGEGLEHATVRHRPLWCGTRPPISRAPALGLRRHPAANRQLDHLLLYRRRAPIRADGCLYPEHGERHHE